MSNSKITISYDSEKLKALEQFSNMEEIEKQLLEHLDKAYKKVPAAVRKYIEGKNTE